MCSDIDRGPPPRLSSNSQALPTGTRRAWDKPVVGSAGRLATAGRRVRRGDGTELRGTGQPAGTPRKGLAGRPSAPLPGAPPADGRGGV